MLKYKTIIFGFANTLTSKKELKDHQKGTHGLVFDVKKPHKNNSVRFT